MRFPPWTPRLEATYPPRRYPRIAPPGAPSGRPPGRDERKTLMPPRSRQPQPHPQPLEPLYTLKVAAELIPYYGTSEALGAWLRRYRFPKRYTHVGRGKRRMRLLSHSELLAIRQALVKEIQPHHVQPSQAAVKTTRAARKRVKQR